MPRKRKHSPVASAESESTSIVIATEPNVQNQVPRKRPCANSEKDDKKEASAQDSSAILDARASTGYECSICLESNNRKRKKNLPCSHTFHTTCINTWLRTRSNRCPVCRQAAEPLRIARPATRNQRRAVLGEQPAWPRIRLETLNNGPFQFGVEFMGHRFVGDNNRGFMGDYNGGFMGNNNGGFNWDNNVGFMGNNNGGFMGNNNGGFMGNNTLNNVTTHVRNLGNVLDNFDIRRRNGGNVLDDWNRIRNAVNLLTGAMITNGGDPEQRR